MKAPNHLSDESKGHWRRISKEFDLGPDAALLLRCALEQFDRAQSARALIDLEGLVIEGKRHPACDIEKTAYGLFGRYMRQLGLDIAAPGPVGRPAGSGGV